MREVPGSNPGRALIFTIFLSTKRILINLTSQVIVKDILRSYGVMVSTLDSESSDPSSNLGRTYNIFQFLYDILGQREKL